MAAVVAAAVRQSALVAPEARWKHSMLRPRLHDHLPAVADER